MEVILLEVPKGLERFCWICAIIGLALIILTGGACGPIAGLLIIPIGLLEGLKSFYNKNKDKFNKK